MVFKPKMGFLSETMTFWLVIFSLRQREDRERKRCRERSGEGGEEEFIRRSVRRRKRRQKK